jgi:hypothetical protein
MHSLCDENGLETWFAPTEEIRVLALNLRLSVLIIRSKYDSHELKEFVYRGPKFSLSVKKIGWKHISRQLKISCICARNSAYLWWIWPQNAILANWKNFVYWCSNGVYLCWIWPQIITRTNCRISCIDAPHVSYRSEIGLKTWSATSKEIRVLVSTCMPSVLNMGLKHDLHQAKKIDLKPICNEYGLATLLTPFVYYRSNFRLSMLNKPRNITCTKRRYTYSFIGAWPTVYMCWVRIRKMTHANWRNSWFGDRHIYLRVCWIWSKILTRANWRHSCSVAPLASHLRWMRSRKINRAKQKYLRTSARPKDHLW